MLNFKRLLHVGLLLVLGAALFTNCYYDNNQELHPELIFNNANCDTTVTISFKSDIQPILNGTCGAGNSCHNASSTSGINLSQYTSVQTVALNGVLWSAITWDGNAAFMPQGSAAPINDCYQARIRKWIDAGAPNN
ncbi:MAG: hypothetical protein EP344_18400 [Bacteroidetes bacterium]|nr:MAG: hypothetical protein EP344_18400 [Bacteroidota bacterium]